MRDEQLLVLNDYLPRVEVVDLEELFFGGGGMLFRPVRAVPQPPGGEEELN